MLSVSNFLVFVCLYHVRSILPIYSSCSNVEKLRGYEESRRNYGAKTFNSGKEGGEDVAKFARDIDEEERIWRDIFRPCPKKRRVIRFCMTNWQLS